LTAKAYRDDNGGYIESDNVIFEENPEDIIDGIYIKDVFYQDAEQTYIEILEECKYRKKVLFRGEF